MKIRIETKVWISICCGIFLFGCVKDRKFDAPESKNTVNLEANATYGQVKGLYKEETFQIQEGLIIEGYITSSDEMGNFFSVLHFQDKPENPSEGFQIEIDLRDSHLLFPEGSKIYIKLKGLYLGKSKDVFKIGGVFTSFGNVSVGRLPTSVVNEHIFISENEKVEIKPTPISIDGISPNLTNVLVEFEGLQFVDEDLELPFAQEKEETERTLTNCDGNTITMVNSGFSDFQGTLLPSGNGLVTGILLREKDSYQFVIRNLNDIDFNQERCMNLEGTTSTSVFISELADPDNNSGARFVELYNAENVPLALQGWKLLRYTNDNKEVSSTIDLSEFAIEGQSTLVISPNAMVFEEVYGFPADIWVSVNSPADSNGDDNFELVDSFGTVVDVFGVIGEDGSGTNHEFEDGRAVRNVKVKKANAVYTFSEWRLFNDTGEQGTTKEPQNAPEDFTPGAHNK